MCFGQAFNKHLLHPMPGTIQVSVLDFEGLQLPSSPSRTRIKVSMGKREYETWDKGEFSFPLTTLRDNLIVSLQDAEGNEMSRTGVETRLLVEKGVWDDTFPLEGGGYVRMKLQFSLSEEDRHRIRVMRESALRKKQNELLNNEATSRHYAPTAGTAAANSTALFRNQNFVPEDKEGNRSVEKQASPDDTERYRDPSSTTQEPQRFEVYQKDVSSDTSGHDSGSAVSLTDERLRISRQKEALHRGITESKISLEDIPVKLKEALHRFGGPEKRSLLERDQSNVRSMISVFENSQERKIIQPPIKSQTKRIAGEVSLASSSHLGEIKMGKNKPAPLSEGIENPLPTMEESPALTRTDEGSSSFVKKPYEVTTQDMGHLYGLRASTSETASVSGRVSSEHMDTHHGTAMAYSGRGSHPKSSQELNVQGASGHECYSPEGQGGWIFPVKGKRLCLSTAGKQIMNIMGGFWAETTVQPQKMSSSASENVNKSTVHGSAANIKAKDDEKSSQRFRKSKAEGPVDAENSRGPVGQAVRAAIMVGFVTLVLFTRQRK